MSQFDPKCLEEYGLHQMGNKVVMGPRPLPEITPAYLIAAKLHADQRSRTVTGEPKWWELVGKHGKRHPTTEPFFQQAEDLLGALKFGGFEVVKKEAT